jgi:hypothetical protein
MRKKHGSVPKLHTCSGLDSRDEQTHRHSRCHYKRNSGSPPQERTTPLHGEGLRSNRRLTSGSPPPVLTTATVDRRCCDLALAPADARGARTSTPARWLEARVVAVIPSATRTSRAASASAPMAGDTSPPADPHSNPPGRVGRRPLREGAVPVQKQDHPRTRTPP